MKKLLSITFISLFFLSSAPLLAWDSTIITTPPSYELLTARGYQNIFSEGDILIISRFNLEQDDSSGDWCDLLRDTAGCASSPVNPENPETLDTDSVTGLSPMLYELYTGTGSNRILQKQTADIPRISRGLIGFYISDGSGSGVPFNNPETQICLQANQTIWSNPVVNPTSTVGNGCANMIWVGSKLQLINDLKSQIRTLEIELVMPRYTLISEANLITYLGSKYVDEAVPLLSRTIGDAFVIGGERVITATPISGGTLALQDSLTTEYLASPMGANVEVVASDYFGVSGRVFMTILTMSAAFVASGIMFAKTGNGSLSFITLMTISSVSVFFNGISIGVLFTVLALGSLIAAGFFLRKMPN